MNLKNKGKKRANNELVLIAGPCSVDTKDLDDIYKIAEIRIKNKQKAVFGTRVVGLKSRTVFKKNGQGMGIDYKVFMHNLNEIFEGCPVTKFKMLPSIQMAKKIIHDTHMLVATEIMSPLTQLPLYEKIIPRNKLMIWNPAVNQLGWPVLKTGHYAKKNGWYVGLKNGKWLHMEENWLGLMHFAGLHTVDAAKKLIFIQRGVDIPDKGDHRNLPVHKAAHRIKNVTSANIYFDPSHSLGPKLRHKITEAVMEAMQMKTDNDNYLYHGVLIEVGRSPTDTNQHISIQEFEELCHRLAEFRTLVPPT